MTSNVTVAGGGWTPGIEKRLQTMADDMAPLVDKGGFDKIFVEKLRAAPNMTLIDPRDGRHYRLIGEYIVPVPELDLASGCATERRQLLALNALTESECVIFDIDAEDP